MSDDILSNAKRPKNSWSLLASKSCETYQVDIYYKTVTGKKGLYSSSPKNSVVKVPFGPPVKCWYESTYSSRSGDVINIIKFSNGVEVKGFDELIFKQIDAGENEFTRKIVSMCVKGKKKLLMYYINLLQHSAGFIHHNDSLHTSEGFMVDKSGIGINDLEKCGGSLEDYQEFTNLAKANALDPSNDSCLNSAGLKRACKESGATKSSKISKMSIINENEVKELSDQAGLEKQIQRSYLGEIRVPVDNLDIPNELSDNVVRTRVHSITLSMQTKYDPSQTTLVVCPKNPGDEVDLTNTSNMKFWVVQKIHSFLALKELNRLGQLKNLEGHDKGDIRCYVLNSGSVSLWHYNYLRGNGIESMHVRKTFPQDLLHVYASLVTRIGKINALKTLDRIAKACRVGPDESASLKKMCSTYSDSSFTTLMNLITKFENYEIRDIKVARNAGSIARCEKQKMTNAYFNKLAKCDQDYLVRESGKVLNKDISLKTLIDNYKKYVELEKTYDSLSKIAGFKSKTQLLQQYPGKFDSNIVSRFNGAEVQGSRKNKQASDLEKYFHSVVEERSDRFVPGLSFMEIDDIREVLDMLVTAKFDFYILNMKKRHSELYIKLVDKVIKSSDSSNNVVLLLFSSEVLQFEALAYFRGASFDKMEQVRVHSVYFTDLSGKIVNGINENMKFGILIGKFSISLPSSLSRSYNSVSAVINIVRAVCVPKSNICVITEPGLAVIEVHSVDDEFKVCYIGNSQAITKIMKHKKDTNSTTDEDNNGPAIAENFLDRNDNIEVGSLSYSQSKDESTTSPIKCDPVKRCMDDSGVCDCTVVPDSDVLSYADSVSSKVHSIPIKSYHEQMGELERDLDSE